MRKWCFPIKLNNRETKQIVKSRTLFTSKNKRNLKRFNCNSSKTRNVLMW